jgi:hypothetical protein
MRSLVFVCLVPVMFSLAIAVTKSNSLETEIEQTVQVGMALSQSQMALEQQIQQLEFELDGGLSASAPDPVLSASLKEQLSVLYAQREFRSEHNPLDQGAETCPGVPLTGLPIMVTGTTVGYAHNHSPYVPCGGTAAPDVVYSFVAPHSLTYTFSTEGSDYDTYLYIIGVGPAPAQRRSAVTTTAVPAQLH